MKANRRKEFYGVKFASGSGNKGMDRDEAEHTVWHELETLVPRFLKTKLKDSKLEFPLKISLLWITSLKFQSTYLCVHDWIIVL